MRAAANLQGDAGNRFCGLRNEKKPVTHLLTFTTALAMFRICVGKPLYSQVFNALSIGEGLARGSGLAVYETGRL